MIGDGSSITPSVALSVMYVCFPYDALTNQQDRGIGKQDTAQWAILAVSHIQNLDIIG